MASEHTLSAIVDANSFAMEASFKQGKLASFKLAACKTNCRAASICVAISAKRNATA